MSWTPYPDLGVMALTDELAVPLTDAAGVKITDQSSGLNRIKDLPLAAALAPDDWMAIDGQTNGTRRYDLKQLGTATLVVGSDGAEYERTVYADGSVRYKPLYETLP